MPLRVRGRAVGTAVWQPVLAMDGATIATVVVKTLAYLASLTTAGSALALASLSRLDAGTVRMVRRLGLAGALAAGMATLALVPMGAIYLAGGSWSGAADTTLVGMVAESPVGESAMVRLAGLAVIAVSFFSVRVPRLVAIAGAVVVCASFAFRGHVLAEPRMILGALVTAHLMGLAYWVGAFAPLYRLAGHADPVHTGEAAAEFGRRALWIVPALAVAGGGLLVLLAGNPLEALGTPYGRLLAVKVAIFLLLLGLAGFNKLRLTPALLAGDAGAAVRLQAIDRSRICSRTGHPGHDRHPDHHRVAGHVRVIHRQARSGTCPLQRARRRGHRIRMKPGRCHAGRAWRLPVVRMTLRQTGGLRGNGMGLSIAWADSRG